MDRLVTIIQALLEYGSFTCCYLGMLDLISYHGSFYLVYRICIYIYSYHVPLNLWLSYARYLLLFKAVSVVLAIVSSTTLNADGDTLAR